LFANNITGLYTWQCGQHSTETLIGYCSFINGKKHRLL